MVDIFIQSNAVTTGAGLTGLVNNTAGLTAYYHRDTANASTVINLVSATLGTFTSSGFIVVDGTNMPGLYQIGIPNAALASGAKTVVIYLQGATSMMPCILEIELTAFDNQSATVTVGTNNDKTGYSIASGGIGSGAHAAAELNNIADAQLDRIMSAGTDSGGDNTTNRTVRQALRTSRNKVNITAGTMTVYKEDDSTASYTAAITTSAGNPITTVDPA